MERLENIVISVRIDTNKETHSKDFELQGEDVGVWLDLVYDEVLNSIPKDSD